MVAAFQLMFPPGKSEAIDLHGPAYSIRQVAEQLGTHIGKKLNVIDIPPAGGQVAALVQAGLSQEWAEAMAEMNAGFGEGKIRPVGDRLVHGRTTLDTVIGAIAK